MKRSYEEDTKYFNELAKFRVMCKCGHSVIIKPSKKKVICTFCGRYVFRRKEDEFKYRLKEKLKWKIKKGYWITYMNI